jgi:hypothetical protein
MTNDTKGDALVLWMPNSAIAQYSVQPRGNHKYARYVPEDELQALRTRLAKAERVIRHVANVLGPKVPDCINNTCEGCAWEWDSALAETVNFLATAPTPEASAGGAIPSTTKESP